MPHVIRSDGSEEELVEDINNSGEEGRVDKSEPRLLLLLLHSLFSKGFFEPGIFSRVRLMEIDAPPLRPPHRPHLSHGDDIQISAHFFSPSHVHKIESPHPDFLLLVPRLRDGTLRATESRRRRPADAMGSALWRGVAHDDMGEY